MTNTKLTVLGKSRRSGGAGRVRAAAAADRKAARRSRARIYLDEGLPIAAVVESWAKNASDDSGSEPAHDAGTPPNNAT